MKTSAWISVVGLTMGLGCAAIALAACEEKAGTPGASNPPPRIPTSPATPAPNASAEAKTPSEISPAGNSGDSRAARAAGEEKGAPVAGETVDLTPKYAKGQTITFKQRTVRKDVTVLGNPPPMEKPAEAAGNEGKDASKDGKPAEPTREGSRPGAGAAAQPTSPAGTTPAAPKPESAKPEAAKPAGNPMSSTTSVDATATYEVRVVEVNDKGVAMEVELKQVVASGELSKGKFSWDSGPTADEKDAGNPIMMAFRPIVGAVTKVYLDPHGNIYDVQPDPRLGAGPTGELAPVVQQLTAPDGVRLRFGQLLWMKDGREPATVGTPWTNVDEMNFRAVGKFTFETSNTVKSVQDGVANIDVTGVVKLAGAEAGQAPAGTLAEQALSGSCAWDTKTGTARAHEWKQKTVLNMKIGGSFDVHRTSEFTVTTTRQ